MAILRQCPARRGDEPEAREVRQRVTSGLDEIEENERRRTRGSAGGLSKWMRVAPGVPEFGEGERLWWEKGIERS